MGLGRGCRARTGDDVDENDDSDYKLRPISLGA